MKSPFTNKEMSIQKEWRTMTFRKEEFKVLFHYYQCEDTGEKFEDEQFATLNYNQLVNQYRAKYAIPFPEQIKTTREKYGLSASKMSEILGFGINSYRQYEAGEVPNQSNAKLIQLADDPEEFIRLIELCGTLEDKERKKLSNTIDKLLEEQSQHYFEKHLLRYLFETYLPGSKTGYRIPNLNKFKGMVVFFAEKLEPWKVKMNKLLFYADFLMYKKSGFAISGIPYRAIHMGPVPNNFHSLFEYLANQNVIEIKYQTFDDGGMGEQFIPYEKKGLNVDIFSKAEWDVLEFVAKRFEKTSTQQIIEISHNEKAWKENESERKIIDYNYSFDLS